jgi:excisionase family DNA binding protein
MSELEVADLRPRLLPIEAVMAQLGVGRSTVFELIANRQLRSVKIGRRRLVPQVAVDELIANLIAKAEPTEAA